MSPPPSQRPDPAEHRRALRVKDPEVAAALGCVTAALESASVARRSGEAMGIHVGCSGGPDSVALLLLLDLAAHGQGLRLSVGHVDHGLRASSAGEARAVQALAQRLGWPCDCAQLALAQG